jgi:HEAT repeat protein/tRNA A-37 threonylcarbamoyl transferase component Bud32
MAEPEKHDEPNRFDEILAEYLIRIDRGEEVDREEFIRQHPEVGEELRAYFADADAVDDAIGSESALPDGDEGPLPVIRYLGDYELFAVIGRGGMGVVYKARQRSLDRIVAVKMIQSRWLAEPGSVERFHREARAAATLQHPNIVRIHEIGKHENWHYFSMDYVEGLSLAEMTRERTLHREKAARYVRQAAAAIAYAHSQEIVHRDLKPSNILIDEHDEPRITDFGLAKHLAEDSDLSRDGQVVGTLPYMAPEQAEARREAMGPATDVYGLGATLYQLLTGRPPFLADSDPAILRQVLTADPIFPSLINPDVDRRLEAICLKCLEKNPKDRYVSAGQLAEELTCYLNDDPLRHTRPAGLMRRAWRKCKRNALVATLTGMVALLVVLVLTVSYFAFSRQEAPPEIRPHFYLIEQLADEDSDIQGAAVDELTGLGVEAIPTLEEALRRENPHVRLLATGVLKALGPEGSAALVPALVDESDEVRALAKEAVLATGEQAEPILREALAHDDLRVREAVVQLLGETEPRTVETKQALIRACRDESRHVREAAVAALAAGDPKSPDVVEALQERLQDEASQVKVMAVATLIGEDTVDPSMLIDSLEEEEEEVWQAAFEPVAELGPRATRFLAAGLNSTSLAIRRCAAERVHQLAVTAPLPESGANRDAVVNALIGATEDEDGQTRLAVLKALVQWEIAPTPVLEKAVHDSESQIRLAALQALVRSEIAPTHVLETAIRDSEWQIRLLALGALAQNAQNPPLSVAETALRDEHEQIRSAGMALLAPAGARGIPVLIGGLNSQYLDVRCGAAQQLGSLGPQAKQAVGPLISLLDCEVGWRPDEAGDRVAAMSALGQIDPTSTEVAEALVVTITRAEFLVSHEETWEAPPRFGSVLRRCGPVAVPPLLDALKAKNGLLRRNAVVLLGYLLEADSIRSGVSDGTMSSVLLALGKTLRDDDRGTREVGTVALVRLRTEPAAQFLLGLALIDARDDARSKIEKALEEVYGIESFFGSLLDIKKTLSGLHPELRCLQRDNSPFPTRQGSPHLESVAEEFMPDLTRQFSNQFSTERDIQSIGTIGSEAVLWQLAYFRPEVVRYGGPEMVAALTNIAAERFEETAVYLLGEFGPKANEAIPTLIERLRDEQVVVLEALGKIGPEAVPALVDVIEEEQGWWYDDAARAIGLIGPSAREAAPVLIAALQDEGAIRRALHRAFDQFGERGRSVIPALEKVIKSGEGNVNEILREAFGEADSQKPRELFIGIFLSHTGLQQNAAFALGRIEPDASSAAPVLLTALESRYEDVRFEAAIALARIGFPSERAVPVLIEALKRKDDPIIAGRPFPDVPADSGRRQWKIAAKREAAEALGEIGTLAAPAIEHLEKLLQHDDEAIRAAAEEAIRKIQQAAKPTAGEDTEE